MATSHTPETAHHRAVRANAVRKYGRDHPVALAAKAELDAQVLYEHAQRVAGTLTAEQRKRIAGLLVQT